VDAVALAAAIGGSTVGLAGVATSAWSNWLQHVSARELSARQQEHERDLARGARLFERRGPVYETMIAFLYPWMERVDATEPFMRYAGEPDPPDPPSTDEWRMMHVRLRTYGSPEVADAYDVFGEAIRSFFFHLPTIRADRAHGTDAAESVRLHKEFEAARVNVRKTLRSLERLVSDELASL
jgi:hypothetical protein